LKVLQLERHNKASPLAEPEAFMRRPSDHRSEG
jgi:hypothetical protein